MLLNERKCPRLHFTTGRKLWAVLPVLYTKCQTLITFLGIYCNNMNHDASLWYSCGCSVLSPQDLRGVDFIWFSTSVSEWEPHELRREGSQEPKWAVLSVAVLVCLCSVVVVCADLNTSGDPQPELPPFPPVSTVAIGLGCCTKLPRQLQTPGTLERNVARVLECWYTSFLTFYILSWELDPMLNPGDSCYPENVQGFSVKFLTWWIK